MPTIKTEMSFSIQENGNFKIIMDGSELGFIVYIPRIEQWAIQADQPVTDTFKTHVDAKKFCIDNLEVFA